MLVSTLLETFLERTLSPADEAEPRDIDLLQQAYLLSPQRIPEVTALLRDIIHHPDKETRRAPHTH